jgi:O-antigen/teichoic acid export membrane protein
LKRIFKFLRQLFKSALIQSAGIYTITNALNAAIPFLLMPVLTRYLTPADYGMVSMFGLLVSFASAFVGLNADSAISRQYYDRDEVDIRRYISTGLLIFLCSSIIVFLLFYLLAEPLSRITSVPRQWLWAVVIVCAAQFLSRTVLILWQVQVKPKAYGTYQIAQTLTNAGLSLLFVVVFGFAWQGRITGQIITAVMFAIVAIWILYRDKWLPATVNTAYINHIFKFGIPLIPHTLGAIMITMTDRLFITNMVGLKKSVIFTGTGGQLNYFLNG